MCRAVCFFLFPGGVHFTVTQGSCLLFCIALNMSQPSPSSPLHLTDDVFGVSVCRSLSKLVHIRFLRLASVHLALHTNVCGYRRRWECVSESLVIDAHYKLNDRVGFIMPVVFQMVVHLVSAHVLATTHTVLSGARLRSTTNVRSQMCRVQHGN